MLYGGSIAETPREYFLRLYCITVIYSRKRVTFCSQRTYRTVRVSHSAFHSILTTQLSRFWVNNSSERVRTPCTLTPHSAPNGMPWHFYSEINFDEYKECDERCRCRYIRRTIHHKRENQISHAMHTPHIPNAKLRHTQNRENKFRVWNLPSIRVFLSIR